MKNKLFSLVLILLFILGVGIFVLPQKDSSKQENRTLAKNNDISINKLVSSCENVLNDQFYFRDIITKTYHSVNVKLSSLFGANNVEGISVVQLTDEVVSLNGEYLANGAIAYDDETLDGSASRGFNFNEFDLMYPDIKSYVYKCTRIEELINTDYPLQEKCWDEYIYQLNPSISYSKLQINNIDDYKKYYYKTDRHWNSTGSYQGYRDIIEMIGKDFDIGKPKDIKEKIEYPFEFKGEFAKNIGFSYYNDHIEDYNLYDVGEFDYYTNDIKQDFYEYRNKYSADGNTATMSDYEYYYGYSTFTRLFDFNENTKPNLLILSTSYAYANSLWIASHFNQTLLLDLRCRPDNFDLKYYIDKYDIDAVLMETSYESLFINGHMYIPLS